MQRDYFWSRSRNNLSSGAFGSGKTYASFQRGLTHLMAFDNYKLLVSRKTYKQLVETTMETFLKVCPKELIVEHSEKDGYTQLINGSEIIWKHLDIHDEQSLRGLEINSAVNDQSEEMEEAIYWVLDSRIGRWDKAKPSAWLLKLRPDWPKRPNGDWVIPNYHDCLCNPDTYFHWLYRLYHPDSPVRIPEYAFFHSVTDPTMNDPETMKSMAGRDPEWVAKYMKGEWGASLSSIHTISKDSYLKYDKGLLQSVIANSAIYRSMDHGNSAPTCCLWVGQFKGVYIFYREYYLADAVISRHRQNIADLTTSQEYVVCSWADPSIFQKTGQKEGAFWTVADEYLTDEIPGPAIAWIAADNNEMGTRNRINELLAPSSRFKHPVTGESPAPGIYFMAGSPEYPQGVNRVPIQISAQRKEELGTINGKTIYGDNRDDSIEDHAYDAFRYFIAMHGMGITEKSKTPPKNSIESHLRFMQQIKRREQGAHLL